jgi:hypothetical protein
MPIRERVCAFGLLALLISVPTFALDTWTQRLWDSLSYQKIDLDSLQEALGHGANPNATDASQARTVTILSRAADLASMVDRPGEPDSTFPAEALQAVKLLLKAGAKIQPYDGDILYGPVYWGNLELTKLLIQAGASPQKFSYRTGSSITPMELAETKNWPSVIDLLQSCGIARLEKRDSL